MLENIKILGARTHNLKNVNVNIPRNKLTVVTGLSGSGKSSLVTETLYAGCQNKFFESLSAYARNFLPMLSKPDVDSIEGLSPAIAIEQKTTTHNPRSTVGTITEVYDYLRLLFARVGIPRCPYHNLELIAMSISEISDSIIKLDVGTNIMIVSPVVNSRKGEFAKLINEFKQLGFKRLYINGKLHEITSLPNLNLYRKNTIEVVVDRLKIRTGIDTRLNESLESAIKLNKESVVKIVINDDYLKNMIFSTKHACPHCDYNLNELEPRIFSFNSPNGACGSCDGLGKREVFSPDKIVHDETLTLAQGAVRGWDRRNNYYFPILEALANHFDFSLQVPFNKLNKDIQKIILHGTGRKKIKYLDGSEECFIGAVTLTKQRYFETDSDVIRNVLAQYISEETCSKCLGTRLKLEARHVFVNNYSLPQIVDMSIDKIHEFFSTLKISGYRGEIAKKIVKEIIKRLTFLQNVGLSYLTLNRSSSTLSGGEIQRIRLASQIGSGLVGVIYILDEPSIGLHQRDNQKLLKTLFDLRDLGNSVIVIEHDKETINSADHLVDVGPKAGIYGGEIIFSGPVSQILAVENSLTGQYLSGKKSILIPKKRNRFDKQKILKVTKANCNNLKNVDLEIPIGLFTCVTGVSGSGKSSLINDTLYPLVFHKLNRKEFKFEGYEEIFGLEHIDKIINIDQSAIGRTPRSNPATYTGLFIHIRELFANTFEARTRGYSPGRFSFNLNQGRCQKCEGGGVIKIEMHFLPDMYVTCDACLGRRYNRQTLEIKYKDKDIYQILEMSVDEALEFFTTVPQIKRKLQTLAEVSLDYIKLGQNALTLSGGEAQRIKLARELAKKDTGKTVYILDEPTTGLHFEDIKKLLKILHTLRDRGNTIIVIEHNLDVIKTADWVIDVGPEGGEQGGKIVCCGSPEKVASHPTSYTAQFLQKELNVGKKVAKI